MRKSRINGKKSSNHGGWLMSAKPFTMDQTWLACVGCGRKADLLEERRFQCPVCGNLYYVDHDFSGLPSFDELMRIFDDRAAHAHVSRLVDGRQDPRLSSGIWRYHELIMPHLPVKNIVSLGEGCSPIVRAGKNLREWVGLDDLHIIKKGVNPTGSFKDDGGTVMMTIASTAGIDLVICASTGDTSAMAAAYAAAAGIQCAVVLPYGKVTAVQLAQPLVFGASVITLPGSFDDCMKAVKKMVNDGIAFPANSLNPTRIEGHQATVFQLAQYFGWELPDRIVVPVGNGSNASSIGKALRLMQRLGYDRTISKILGCQSAAASPLSASWERVNARSGSVNLEDWGNDYHPVQVGETTATAARIGDPVSRIKVMNEVCHSDGSMVTVPEELLNEAVAVCGSDGHFLCPQSGTALAGLKIAVASGQVSENERVVVVSTADGLKFTESAAMNLQGRIMNAGDCEVSTILQMLHI